MQTQYTLARRMGAHEMGTPYIQLGERGQEGVWMSVPPFLWLFRATEAAVSYCAEGVFPCMYRMYRSHWSYI